jgi:hypothetical protein
VKKAEKAGKAGRAGKGMKRKIKKKVAEGYERISA